MSQLTNLKLLLGNPVGEDDLLNLYLINAGQIICDLRNTNAVETKYEGVQLSIAVEFYNKRGAEGQTGHTENGIARTYSSGDISKDLLNQIIPKARNPFLD